jgi:VanZ family protein
MRMTQRRLLTLWLPVVVWMAAIFIGSSQQGLPTPESAVWDTLIKKTGHVLEYSLLGVLLWRACHGSMERTTNEEAGLSATSAMPANPGLLVPSVLTMILGGLYAASDELHQSFVPTRHGNLRDVTIDTVAVTLGMILLVLWRRCRSHSHERS